MAKLSFMSPPLSCEQVVFVGLWMLLAGTGVGLTVSKLIMVGERPAAPSPTWTPTHPRHGFGLVEAGAYSGIAQPLRIDNEVRTFLFGQRRFKFLRASVTQKAHGVSSLSSAFAKSCATVTVGSSDAFTKPSSKAFATFSKARLSRVQATSFSMAHVRASAGS